MTNYMLSICIFNITTLSSYMSAVILPTINITGRESYWILSFLYKNISHVNNQHINLMIYRAFFNLIIFFNQIIIILQHSQYINYMFHMHYLPVLIMLNQHFYYPCYHIQRSDFKHVYC